MGSFFIPFFSNPELISESKYGSHYKVAIQVFKNNKLLELDLKVIEKKLKIKNMIETHLYIPTKYILNII